MTYPTLLTPAVTYANLANISTTTVLAAPLPENLQAGDQLIFYIACNTNSGEGEAWTVVPQDANAWTFRDRVVAGTLVYVVFTATYAVGMNRNFTSNIASLRRSLPITYAVRSARPFANWTFNAGVKRVPNGTSTSNIIPGVPTTYADSIVLTASFERTNATEPSQAVLSGDATFHSYFWHALDNNPVETAVFGTKNVPTPATTGSVTVTYPNAQTSNGAGLSIVIPGPAPVVPPIEGGMQAVVKTANGTVTGQLVIKTIDGPKAVKSMIPVPTGKYTSVQHMLAQDKFYVAHRGGSRSFPEMSLHAYTQSIVLGYGALEVSLARTSDGVWFGLHDQTLDRTSGVSGQTASSLTWAQVQAYNILASTAVDNPNQPNRPYMRFEEILERYYKTHILVLDPKHQLSRRLELFNWLDTLDSPQTRVMWKYFGIEGNSAGTSGLAVDAGARGYERWGYFYDADIPNLATYQGRWSVLGYPYGGANWSAIHAYGKKTMAHICENQAAVNTAFANGADGVMVSGVAVVPPVG